MSNGGNMAQALACKYPTIFTGVVNIVGMQHKDLSCIPDKPVNFIIYGAMKDTIVPPINIKSSDGYFYEPMRDTFNAWSEKFDCKFIKQLNFNLYDDLVEKCSVFVALDLEGPRQSRPQGAKGNVPLFTPLSIPTNLLRKLVFLFPLR